jgi:hypothetical protein
MTANKACERCAAETVLNSRNDGLGVDVIAYFSNGDGKKLRAHLCERCELELQVLFDMFLESKSMPDPHEAEKVRVESMLCGLVIDVARVVVETRRDGYYDDWFRGDLEAALLNQPPDDYARGRFADFREDETRLLEPLPPPPPAHPGDTPEHPLVLAEAHEGVSATVELLTNGAPMHYPPRPVELPSFWKAPQDTPTPNRPTLECLKCERCGALFASDVGHTCA